MFIVNIISLLSLSSTIIDSEIGNTNVVIPCPVDRTKWASPLILQWYRSNNNYTKPIASQFDNYPVHIDDLYRNKYSLLSNGSLNIESVQLNDNDTFECRLILIDRGLLDVKNKYFIIFRVNGIFFKSFLVTFHFLSNNFRATTFYQSIEFTTDSFTLFYGSFYLPNLWSSSSKRYMV